MYTYNSIAMHALNINLLQYLCMLPACIRIYTTHEDCVGIPYLQGV